MPRIGWIGTAAVDAAIAVHAADETGVHGVGASSVCSETVADNKITSHAGAVDPHGDRAYADGIVKTIVTGTYVGNDADGRQITVGFKCSCVIICGATTNRVRTIMIPGAAYRDSAAANNEDCVAAVYLHATDGFVVEQTNWAMNNSGETYHYYAVSE